MSEAVQTQSEVVQMQIDDSVALLTLNRPERLNAWTPATRTCA
jgi:enoyl-CoA hydratase/carnithine racemase